MGCDNARSKRRDGLLKGHGCFCAEMATIDAACQFYTLAVSSTPVTRPFSLCNAGTVSHQSTTIHLWLLRCLCVLGRGRGRGAGALGDLSLDTF